MRNKNMYNDNPSIFQKFIVLTDQKQILIDKVTSKIKTEYTKNNIRFLDIGCADGSVTIPIIEKLTKSYKVDATGIEFSETLLNEFKDNSNIDINLINNNVELLNEFPISDFILISHVLPYINDVESFIDKIVHALLKESIALIVVSNPLSDDTQIKNKILDKKDKEPLSLKIEKILKNKKISYKKEIVQSKMNASGIIKMDENGKSLIEFFTHRNFDDIIDKDVQSMRDFILQYINKEGYIIKKEDYFWISF